MADVKNIITLGIGASPGKLLWFFTSGLEGAAVIPATAGVVSIGDSASIYALSMSDAPVYGLGIGDAEVYGLSVGDSAAGST